MITRRVALTQISFFLLLTLLLPSLKAQEQGFTERKLDEITPISPSPLGKQVLDFKPDKWKFAETDNFILAFRRVTEARRVAREVEFTLAHVAKILQFSPKDYKNKSFIFIFEDSQEWRTFLNKIDMSLQTLSFARGDELFLNVRKASDTGKFDERTLAHEATHAIIARLYQAKYQNLPLWLHEGIAEYMAAESMAARRKQSLRLHQKPLGSAGLTLRAILSTNAYPASSEQRGQFYQSSERLFRFLCDGHPRERIRSFIDAIADLRSAESALLEIYGDKYKSFEELEKCYELGLN